jgi:hypothetical protein
MFDASFFINIYKNKKFMSWKYRQNKMIVETSQAGVSGSSCPGPLRRPGWAQVRDAWVPMVYGRATCRVGTIVMGRLKSEVMI